jgi:hypothetical protein
MPHEHCVCFALLSPLGSVEHGIAFQPYVVMLGDAVSEIPPIPRTVLSKTPTERRLQQRLFEEVTAQEITFSGFDFSYSIFRGAYFKRCVFERCKFIGCHFENSSFRSARFRQCDFRYATFDQTVLPIDELLANQPEWPNVRRELMQRLRVNAISTGDYEAEKACIREELLAQREHLRRARERKESYYAQKYSGFHAQARIRIQSAWFWTMHTFWGHGENLWRAFVFIAVFIAMCPGIALLTESRSLMDDSVAILGQHYATLLVATMNAFFDIDYTVAKNNFPLLLIGIVIVRFGALGLLVAALYRRLAQR